MFVLSLLACGAAHAACSSPAGQASQTRYDATANKLYYCNNATWVEMGNGTAGFANPATADLNMNGRKIINLGTPSGASDGVPKTYVDARFGAMTNGKWCRGDGTKIVCDQDAPAGGDGDTLAALGCSEGQIAVKTASGWGCADMPAGSGGGEEPSCGGVEAGGACWYAGASGAACDVVCMAHGGCNEVATKSIGSSGSNAACQDVLTLLSLGSGSVSALMIGGASGQSIGCHIDGTARRRDPGYSILYPTTCASLVSGKRRACACNE